MAEESAVKVCVRVRPFLEREESDPSDKTKPVEVFWEAKENLVRQLEDGTSTKSFAFDRVFTAEGTTNQLYQDMAKPLVVSTVEGYNGTIFAYGQTASGKTFTMMGSDMNPGIIPLAVDDVFRTIKKCPKKEFLLRVSYMEIYNETVTDLLVDSWKRKPLEVREAINKNIYVADLTEELVTSPAQALAWIRKGEKNRHYGSTKMNHRSSRSHAIFRMILESRERTDMASGENADGAIIVSHLNLVDLAGSERASQTGAEGARLKEGCNINRSLFTLGQVIKKLSEESQRSFINYRDSKLTRILQNSLGGNAKTVILCTITTASLDETLSTLQFASAAKKMKNDPHVTEVSDDGALLKRYRNEIVDLKRRLLEVSSVTQTTATEKEELFQILQEKQQLQLEQEDRIRNLTELLVTSNNITQGQPVPKRRVTWGGKMLRHALVPIPGSDLPYNSFSESVCQKTNTYQCSVDKISEEGEEFFSDWFPDEPSDDTKSCEDFVTLRSSENRVVELELQLQSIDQEKRQALDQIVAMKQEAAEVNLKLQSEAEEKELLASERDNLQQQLDILRTNAVRTEEEAAVLSQKLKEKSELHEFERLEEMCAKEHEIELQNEIGLLKNVMDSRELQFLELKNNLDMVTKELKEKTQVADDLQNMCGKDLVEEVANLRHSLDDAQGLGKETKKEWALLRSENLALEELKNTLTTSNEKMKAEVHSLRKQLETEKSNFKKMKMDLEKELNVVFNENAKLIALCDGKLPKNIMDSVELESTVTKLKKDLEASQQAEALLSTRLEELKSLQVDQNEVNNLEKISAEELEKLELAVTTVTAERDQLKMDLQENIDMVENSKSVLDTLQYEIEELKTKNCEMAQVSEEKELDLRESTLKCEHLDATLQTTSEQKNQLEAELQQFIDKAAENERLLHSLQTQLQEQVQRNNDVESTSQEKQAQLQNQVEDSKILLDSLQSDIDELKNKSCEIVKISEEKELHLKQNIQFLRMELETVKEEKEKFAFEKETEHRASMKEIQKLLGKMTSLGEEKDKILDNLEELCQDKSELNAQLEDKIEMIKTMAMELDTVKAERDGLCFNKEAKHLALLEEAQKTLSRMTSLSEEKDELLETVDGVSQEKVNLSAQLMETMEMMTLTTSNEKMKSEVHSLRKQLETEKSTLKKMQMDLEKELNVVFNENAQLFALCDGKLPKNIMDSVELESTVTKLKKELEASQQAEALLSTRLEELKSLQADQNEVNNLEKISAEELEKLELAVTTVTAERDQLKMDLQENIDMMIENQEDLRNSLGEIAALKQRVKQLVGATVNIEELGTQAAENESLLHSLRSQLQEQIQRNNNIESTGQEYQAQLQNQIENSESVLDTLQNEVEELKNKNCEMAQVIEENELDLKESTLKCEQLDATLQTASEQKKQLEAELQQFIDKAAENESLLHSLRSQLQEEIQRNNNIESTGQDYQAQLQNQVENSESVLDTLQNEVEELKNKNCEMAQVIEENELDLKESTLKCEQLDATLQTTSEQKKQLEAELQQFIDKAAENERLLHSLQTQLQEQIQRNNDVESTGQEKQAQLQNQVEDSKILLDSLQSDIDELKNKSCEMVKISEEKELHLKQNIQFLRMELENVKEEKERFAFEKETEHRASMEEIQKLLGKMTSLGEEKDKILDNLEELCQDKSELNAQLEDKIEMIKTMAMELDTVKAERDGLCFNKDAEHLALLASHSEEKDELLETVDGLSQEKVHLNARLMETVEMVQQLEEELKIEKERHAKVQAEAKTSQELLIEAKVTISSLRANNSNCVQKMPNVNVTTSSRLEKSSLQLEESFARFEQFIDICSSDHPIIRDQILTMECFLNESDTFPHATLKAHSIVIGFGPRNLRPLSHIIGVLPEWAQLHKRTFQKLVENDVAIFEEGRLQDLLRCRSEALSCSVQDLEADPGQGHRLSELIKKRQVYVQKMENTLRYLWAGLGSYRDELSAEVRERARFSKQVQQELNRVPLVMSRLDGLFRAESDWRSGVTERRNKILQGILNERVAHRQELQQLKSQAECQLQRVKNTCAILQQTLEDTPTSSEKTLLSDNQHLIELRQSEEKIKVLCAKNKQLKEAQVHANDCVSKYKMATQELQTALLTSQAQVEELRKKLETPEAAELQKVQAQLFKTEMESRAASDEHQQEMERKNMVLHMKEESIRKLKESLRKLQQQGEESFLQGEELAERLLNPRGLGSKSNVFQSGIEEESVKQFQVKVTHLEDVISNQQAELNKWKNRAIKMKYKSKGCIKTASPSTPTKRGLLPNTSVLLQSPQKFVLSSPKLLLDSPKLPPKSPKKQFFDDDKYSEMLAQTRPGLFFDNSNLGLTSDGKLSESAPKPNDCISQ
ncbi:centromere-associated protein E [Stigmatopora argus]